MALSLEDVNKVNASKRKSQDQQQDQHQGGQQGPQVETIHSGFKQRKNIIQATVGVNIEKIFSSITAIKKDNPGYFTADGVRKEFGRVTKGNLNNGSGRNPMDCVYFGVGLQSTLHVVLIMDSRTADPLPSLARSDNFPYTIYSYCDVRDKDGNNTLVDAMELYLLNQWKTAGYTAVKIVDIHLIPPHLTLDSDQAAAWIKAANDVATDSVYESGVAMGIIEPLRRTDVLNQESVGTIKLEFEVVPEGFVTDRTGMVYAADFILRVYTYRGGNNYNNLLLCDTVEEMGSIACTVDCVKEKPTTNSNGQYIDSGCLRPIINISGMLAQGKNDYWPPCIVSTAVMLVALLETDVKSAWIAVYDAYQSPKDGLGKLGMLYTPILNNGVFAEHRPQELNYVRGLASGGQGNTGEPTVTTYELISLFFKKAKGLNPNELSNNIDGAVFTSTVAEGDPNGYWLRTFQKAIPSSHTDGYLNKVNTALNNFTGDMSFNNALTPVATIGDRTMIQKTSVGFYRSGEKVIPTEKFCTLDMIDGFSRNPQEMQNWYRIRYFGFDLIPAHGRTLDVECDLIRRKMVETLVGNPTYTQHAYRALLDRQWLAHLQAVLISPDVSSKGGLMFEKINFTEYGNHRLSADLFQTGFTPFSSAPSVGARGRNHGSETVY